MHLEIECIQHNSDGKIMQLEAKISLKNQGLSKIAIDRKSSALRVNKLQGRLNSEIEFDEIREVQWNHLGTFTIFNEHEWIEPSEIIYDRKMVEFKSNETVFKIEAIVMTKKQEWYAACIAAQDKNKLLVTKKVD